MRGIRVAPVVFAASAALAAFVHPAVAAPDVTIPPVLTTAGPIGGNGAFSAIHIATSADGSRVVFRTLERLTADDTNSILDLYTWSEADGVELVTAGSVSGQGYTETLVSADGSTVVIYTPDRLLPDDADATQDAYAWSGGTLTLVSTGPTDQGSSHGFARAVSPDGATVIFEATGRLTSDDGDDMVDVYARTAGTTTLLSATASGGSGEHHANFSAMSRDGSHVFFTTPEALDPVDDDTLSDLYSWSGGSVSLESTGVDEIGDNEGAYAASTADGSHVYFVAWGHITPEDTDLANPDIYERHAGETRLVSIGTNGEEAGNFVVVEGVSDDGSHVVLRAAGRLVPADTDNAEDLYDVTGGEAVLVSTGPTAPTSPNDGLDYLLGAMTADGTRFFFATREGLVADDLDGSTDVYLREGTTTRLVSDTPGDLGIDASFHAISSDGLRVFFTTSEPLDVDDTNGNDDLAIWEDDGSITRVPVPGSQRSVAFVGSSDDGELAYVRTSQSMSPTDTDGGFTDIYRFAFPDAAPPFVTAEGTELRLGGQPFTFTGMNIYNANSDDWCANNMDGGLLETALDEIGLGGTHGGDHGVIRAWFFQPLATAGTSGVRDWTRFDRTIAAAKAAGYYVIPTLGNQWGECGHKGATAPYKYPSWYETGYKQLQPEDSEYATYASYRDWVTEVVLRYRDEPAILAWQLLNEAETNPVWPEACPPGPEPFDAIHGWATDMSALIKSIDPNHLVSLGTIGGGQCGTSGPDYKALHAIPTIDLCEFHDYNPWDAMPGDAFNGLALRIQQCGELDKPLFIGEVGLRPVDIGGSYDSRVASLRAKLQTQRAAGIVGHLVWNWGPGPRALDSYDIRAGDPVLQLLADAPDFDDPATPVDSDWVAPFIELTAPGRTLYTLGEPLIASFTCTERGSAGLATCVGTQATGTVLDTSSVHRSTFTVTTSDALGNTRSASRTYDVTAGDVSTEVPGGKDVTITTDPGAFGATPAVPIQTTVRFRTPSGGPRPVSIDLRPATITPPSGVEILGNEVAIDLGGITRPSTDPIRITFLVDSSTGADPATLTVNRYDAGGNPDPAAPCTSTTEADPDPCFLAAYANGPGSDVVVTVLTTQASRWLVVRPVRTSQTITFPAPGNRTMLQTPYNPVASASSQLPVTFTSTTPSVCTAGGTNGATITLVAAGTCTVVASQGGNGTYAPAVPVSRSFSVSRVNQTITFGALQNRTMIQSPVPLSATASSTLPVTFASATPSVCTTGGDNGSSVTLVMPGTCTIVASQPGNATYNPAPDRSRSFTVTLATQSISFPTISNKRLVESPFSVSATATSGLPVVFTTSTPAICVHGGPNGSTITLVAPGSCTVLADQAGDSRYAPAPQRTRTFTVSLPPQTITFANPGAKTLAQSPFTVTATASSGLPVSFTTTTAAVCTASGAAGATITLHAVGTCTVVASQAGSPIYAPATSVSRTFNVTQATQTITFPQPPNAHLSQSPVALTASASSGLPVTFRATSTSVCTSGGPDGSSITLLRSGTCRVVASQGGDAIYRAAPNVARTFSVTNSALAQSITFAALGSRSIGELPLTLSATASSGLPVTFSVAPSSASICSVSGAVLTLENPGACPVTASQAGNATFQPASPVTQTLTATLGGFVQASGTSLVLDGESFRIHGASIYQVSNHGHTADPDQVFGWAEDAGLNTIRLSDIFLQTTADPNAPYDEDDWVWIDGLIARAKAADMKVILDLSSYRNWIVWSSMITEGVVEDCQDDPAGKGVDFAALDPYAVERRAGWTQFMTFVANRVNTVTGIPYRKDPTILVVSIAGEPVGPGFALCGKASSTQELTDFFAWALAEWKSLDPHHLRSTGGLHGTYAGLDANGDPIPSGQEVDGIALFSLADNTLPSLHTYPPQATELPLADGQTPVLAPVAIDLGKPWFTEEFGFRQEEGDEFRAAEFDWMYDRQDEYGSCGSLFWNLGPELGVGTFDVNPSTPLTWARILAEAP